MHVTTFNSLKSINSFAFAEPIFFFAIVINRLLIQLCQRKLLILSPEWMGSVFLIVECLIISPNGGSVYRRRLIYIKFGFIMIKRLIIVLLMIWIHCETFPEASSDESLSIHKWTGNIVSWSIAICDHNNVKWRIKAEHCKFSW